MNEDEPWFGDKLERQSDAEHMLKMLLDRYEARKRKGGTGYTLNLDARWGEGKTFFLHHLQKQMRADGWTVATVNAWQDDHSDDPLTSVMAAIDEMLEPFSDKTDENNSLKQAKRAAAVIGGEVLKQTGFHLIKLTTGVAIGSLMEKVSDGAKLDTEEFGNRADEALTAISEKLAAERVENHKAASLAIHTFKSRIEAAIEAAHQDHSAKLPMCVFIDELDRCRPLYAIKMLEEIKHLFSIDGLVFVVATDSEQLAHSVRAVYGAGFDSNRYLRRFFDRVFVFPEPSKRSLIEGLAESYDIDLNEVFYRTLRRDPILIFDRWIAALKWSNRDLEQVFDIIATFVASWSYEFKIEPVTLLTLVTAFYADSKIPKHRLRVASQVKELLNGCEFPETYIEANTRTQSTRNVPADDLFAKFMKYAKQPMGSNNYNDEHVREYFFEERNARIPGIKHEDTSVLLEYQSRVWNAGRHIIR